MIRPTTSRAQIFFTLLIATLLQGCQPEVNSERRETAARMAVAATTAQVLSTKILALTGDELSDEAVLDAIKITGTIEGMLPTVGRLDVSTTDMDTLVFLLMWEMSKDASAELADVLAEMQELQRQKADMREQVQKLREDVAALEAALRAEYDAATAQPSTESIGYTDLFRVNLSSLFSGDSQLVFGQNSESWVADAAAGDVDATFTCENNQSLATVTVENAKDSTVLARNAGSAIEGVSVSLRLEARTPLRVRATLSAATGTVITPCTLELRYRKPMPYAAWLPSSTEVRNIVELSRDQLTQGQDLLVFFEGQVAQQGLTPRQANILGNWVLIALNRFGSLESLITGGLLEQVIQSPGEQKDSLSEASEAQQLKMQMYMDRMQKADEARSSEMQKFSEIAGQIIQNMK